jgi:hypothetical protein
MNIDLGSPILDIAIGLSFVFFLLAVIASAVTEWVAWVMKLRAKMLREGLEGMLGDKDLVKAIFQHPLIRTELVRDQNAKVASVADPSSGAQERGPSYIAPRNFAKAFRAKFEAGQSDDVDTQLKALGVPTQDLAADNSKETEESLEKWFEDAMDRVNGWYKRNAQKITICIAIVVAFGLNASAVRIVERLDSEPKVREAVVAQAQALAKQGKLASGEGESSLTEAAEHASGAYRQVAELKLPLFWAGDNVPKSPGGIISAVFGCLLTAIAISLGAPFWFDALGKLSNLRTAGKRPEEGEKAEPAGAPPATG